MTEFKCKYCDSPCRVLTSEETRGSWLKCEMCDVSYRFNTKQVLLREHIYIRGEDRIYRFLVDHWDNTSVLFFRHNNISEHGWQWSQIAEFPQVVKYSPQQLRDKLPLLLLFS